MKIATAELKSISAYSQSRHYKTEKLPKELAAAYEERTWRDRMHIDAEGFVMIPPMAFKNSIAEAARFLSMQIPGKGKATYTKHFEAGIIVSEPMRLPVKSDQVAGEWLFVPSDGKRGGGSRVEKCFPVIPQWSGRVQFYIVDDIITEEVFAQHLQCAGNLIGIGRFRPRNNGYYGRFQITSLEWKDGQ